MRNSVKTALFISAFSPALFSVAAARLWAARGFEWGAVYYLLAGLLGTLSVVYIVSALKWLGEAFPFSAKKIESNDALMLGVVTTYFIPFLGKVAEVHPLVILGLLLAAAAVFWYSSSILPSPTLRLLGYRFYKVESDNGVVYTLIATRDILDPRDVRIVNRISTSMLLEVHDESVCPNK